MSDRTPQELLAHHLTLWIDNDSRIHRHVYETLAAQARVTAKRTGRELYGESDKAAEYGASRTVVVSFFEDVLIDFLDDEAEHVSSITLPAFAWSAVRAAVDWRAFASDLYAYAEEAYPAS